MLLLLKRFTCCFCSACVDQGVLRPADSHGEVSGGDGDSTVAVVVPQMLTKEYYALQTAMEKRVVEMETQLSEKTTKLDTYERLEKEMDDVILQAAEG